MQMQTVLAESLGMERGTPKEDTGIEGLSAIEYKEKMASAHVKRLKQEQQELESRKSELLKEQTAKETEIAELEVQRIEKQKAIAIIEKKEAQHEVEKQKIRKQHTDELNAIQAKYNELSKTYRNLESTSNSRIERLEFEKADLLARIKAMLEMLERRLREAITALIEFSRSVFKEFTMSHREKITEYLADAPNVQDAAHTLKVFTRPHLDNRQFKKGSKELDRLTSNLPSVREEVNWTQSRGFRR